MLGMSCWHPHVFARSPRMGHPPLLGLHHPYRCPSPSPHSHPHSRCAGAGQPHKKPPCSVDVHPFPEPVSPTTCAPTSPSDSSSTRPCPAPSLTPSIPPCLCSLPHPHLQAQFGAPGSSHVPPIPTEAPPAACCPIPADPQPSSARVTGLKLSLN